jgi:hypothetical protein
VTLDAQLTDWLRGWLLAEEGAGLHPSARFFLWGLAGSGAVELLNFLRLHETGRQIPARYKRWSFWAARAALGLLGGLLAVAYGVQSPILAFHIGATAPLIIGSLARTPPDVATSPEAKSPPGRVAPAATPRPQPDPGDPKE